MAIQLTAEQKSIRRLFYNTDQYVIPEFQRTYSWGYEECFQLYNDIIEAFEAKEDYFIGNIVIARSNENTNYPQVIDGQQRLISIWILLKVLSIFVTDMDLEETVLMLKSWKKGVESQMKIVSKVFEQSDNEHLLSVAKMKMDDFQNKFNEAYDCQKKYLKPQKCNNSIEYSAMLFFQWISQKEIDNGTRYLFTDYLLDKVFLLPIEMGGENVLVARNRALTIFETINNRGKNLQDADIFKARLYSNASGLNQEDDFNTKWLALKERIDALNITLDEVFRCYYHIIRGQNGIITSEGKLRDFFLTDKSSPLTHSNYDVTIDSLKIIADIYDRIHNFAFESKEIVAWLQVLSLYTNNFPRYAIIAYLFKNTDLDEHDFVEYLKSIARCVYYAGSTTSVKFSIFSIIEHMSSGKEISDYSRPDFVFSDLSTSSRLLSGLSLIAYYQAGNETLDKPIIEKFVYESEIKQCNGNFLLSGITSNNIYILANCLVLGKSIRSLSCVNRLSHVSQLGTKKSFLTSPSLDPENFEKRQSLIESQLTAFFTGK